MQFLPQKEIKGQAIADFLTKNSGSDKTMLHEDLPNKAAEAYSTHAIPKSWEPYSNRASQTSLQGIPIVGVEIALISARNYVIQRTFSLTHGYTNNVAEYNALLIGLQIARELRVKNLKVHKDSELVVY